MRDLTIAAGEGCLPKEAQVKDWRRTSARHLPKKMVHWGLAQPLVFPANGRVPPGRLHTSTRNPAMQRNRGFSFKRWPLCHFSVATARRQSEDCSVSSDRNGRVAVYRFPALCCGGVSTSAAGGPMVWPTPVVWPTATLNLHTRSFSPTRRVLSCSKYRFALTRTQVCPNPVQLEGHVPGRGCVSTWSSRSCSVSERTPISSKVWPTRQAGSAWQPQVQPHATCFASELANRSV